MIDVILAWLVAEDDGARKKIESLLADRDEDLSLIKATLQGKLDTPSYHPSILLLSSFASQYNTILTATYRANGRPWR